MNKSDLISRVSENTNVSKVQAKEIIDATFAAIEKGVKEDGRAVFAGFGTFNTVTRKARTGRNPQTGQPIEIPAKTVVKFKPQI
ncbi:HU family DNA-binding protein [Flavobacterium sp.]|uniref:HU family DNA-binding protein n=1 Tax=Flavobacterium sp. TaxID=239 RepID=UPI003D6A518C